MTSLAERLIKEWGGEVKYLAEPTGNSAMIADVRKYWNDLRGDREFPSRAEIDPVALKQHLPYLSIAEIQPQPFRIRYRLVGTEVARLYAGEMRGRWIDELGDLWPAQDVIDTTETFARLYQQRTPLYALSLIHWDGHQNNVFELGRFPLSEDGTTVTGSLGIDDFTMVTRPQPRAL
jgi:hypothetical protein